VILVALMSLTQGPSVVRAAFDAAGRNPAHVLARSTPDGVAQQPTGSASNAEVNPEDDGDPGGGGSPFGIACPLLIGVPWSTKLLGSAALDFAEDIATADGICAIFETGTTMGSIAGSSGMGDGYVARYSTTGLLEWVRQFGSAVDDAAHSIAIDSQNNVYVAGWTDGTLPGSPNANQGLSDAFLAKYSANGTLRWVRQLGSPGDDWATSLAVDGNDEVLIAGGTEGLLPGVNVYAGGVDYFIARYDTNGSRLMLIERGTPADDIAYGLAVGQAGNVYVAGETSGTLGSPNAGLQDQFVGKYNSSLSQLWIRQRGSTQFDSLYGIAVNANNQVFAVGATKGNLDGNINLGGTDVVVLRFDANGAWVWTDQRGSPADDHASDVAVSTTGDPYATGFTWGILDGNLNAGRSDFFVMKHGTGGTWQWTRQMGTSADDYGEAIAMDGWDNAYASGYTHGNLGGAVNAGRFDAFAVKYDSAGVLR
jgi:hypothetical protein